MHDLQIEENIDFHTSCNMAEQCGVELSIFKVLKGTYKQVKGVSFAYEDTDYANEILQKLAKPIAKRGLEKKVLVTDTYGNTETYDSLGEASSYLQISRSHICQCANGNRKHKDFTFKYLN